MPRSSRTRNKERRSIVEHSLFDTAFLTSLLNSSEFQGTEAAPVQRPEFSLLEETASSKQVKAGGDVACERVIPLLKLRTDREGEWDRHRRPVWWCNLAREGINFTRPSSVPSLSWAIQQERRRGFLERVPRGIK